MKVPFLDLKSQYLEIQDEIDSAISSVISSTEFISGSWSKRFEESFADWNNSDYCAGCANGTDAIEIALEALGVGNGDEVIVPAMTWISTAEAVSRVGAQPVFVDIGLDACIDSDKIEEAVTSRTRAVIVVHLYGYPADVDKIRSICDRLGLFLIEDCAQAHGAKVAGKNVGNWGHVSTFSFYPGKNLGAFGDAGCLVTQDPKLDEKFRQIRNHGQISKHDHRCIGRNSRLDGIQSAVLLAKLPHLKRWLAIRRSTAEVYRKLLPQSILLPAPKVQNQHAYHLFVVRLNYRDKIAESLADQGINSAIHYPKGLPFIDCYRNTNADPATLFPVCNKLQSSILSLPMGDHMSKDKTNYVSSSLNTILSEQIHQL